METSVDNEAKRIEDENEVQEDLVTSLTSSPGDDGTSSISKSTVVITSSQILGSNEESSSARDENGDAVSGDENPNNTQSMIVVPSASDEVSSSMTISMPNEIEQSIHEANTSDNGLTIDETSNKPTSDDVERDYEIPNFKKSIEAELAAKTEQINTELDKVKAEPKIEDEKFEEVLGNSSLLKKITQYGEKNLPEFSRRPLAGQMVTIGYEAYLKDTQKLVDHNDNLSFILGDGDVISGLDIVVSLMDKNEKCEMVVESRHAYGSLGKQPDIPADATLVYKIHLKEFADVTDFNLMSPVERLSLVEAKKLRGNYYYNRQDFHLAVMSYKKGLNYLNEENLRGDELDDDLKKFSDLSQALSMNLALSFYKMGECREALDALEQVIRAKNNHVKALYIKGKILLQLGETEEAIKSLNLSLKYEPDNPDVRKELAKAQAKHKIQYENEKKMYKKMLSGVSGDESQSSPSKLAKKQTKNDADSSNMLSYLATGVIIAVASVGIAWLARYKNII